MTQERFSELIQAQMNKCLSLLSTKGEEYAPEVGTRVEVGDRLAHFKQAAALQNIPVEQAAFGMLAKHLTSIADMCKTPDWFTVDRWQEKLTDSINYLLILSVIVSRDQEKQLSMFDASGYFSINSQVGDAPIVINRARTMVNGHEEDVLTGGGLAK